jgi:hypothetical protein
LSPGRNDEAIRQARRNVELDPLTVQRHVDLAWKLTSAGRHPDPIIRLGRALELATDSPIALG